MFERLEWIIGNDNLKKIANKTVLIVGLGGVGGYTATSLVRSGIKKLIIIDNDIVNLSNLNRQIIATHSTIGMKKVDALEKMILDINPDVKIEKYDLFLTKDNIIDIFSNQIDYVVDACDTVNTKKALINECLQREIPFISSMGTGNRLDPTKLEITDIRKTNNDPLARIMRKWVKDNKINKKIPVVSSLEVPKKLGIKIGSTSFVPSVAGLIITSYIINLIISKEKDE